MARKPDGGAQALVDLKAVDGAYPLYGAIKFEQGGLASVTQGGLALDRSVLDQLHLSLGDSVLVGNASFPIAAVIEQEPDRIAGGPAFGARILLSLGALKKTGLVEPGSLVRWAYRVKTQGGPLPRSQKGAGGEVSGSRLPFSRQLRSVARRPEHAATADGIPNAGRADGDADRRHRGRERGLLFRGAAA